MTAPTTLVWRLAGQPQPVGAVAALIKDEPGVCVMCGGTYSRTADAGKATGANFTDQYLYRRPDSTRICVGCIWCCSGKPPATLRMWSIVATPGVTQPPHQPKVWLPATEGMCLTNRANPRPVAAVLAEPAAGEWLVSIAVSGQKHVLPYAPVNRGGGSWSVRMESTTVTGDPATWRRVLAAAANLRRARHSAQAVLDGRPDLAVIRSREDWDLWQRHHTVLHGHVGSPLLELVLWCLTKETIHDYAR